MVNSPIHCFSLIQFSLILRNNSYFLRSPANNPINPEYVKLIDRCQINVQNLKAYQSLHRIIFRLKLKFWILFHINGYLFYDDPLGIFPVIVIHLKMIRGGCFIFMIGWWHQLDLATAARCNEVGIVEEIFNGTSFHPQVSSPFHLHFVIFQQSKLSKKRTILKTTLYRSINYFYRLGFILKQLSSISNSESELESKCDLRTRPVFSFTVLFCVLQVELKGFGWYLSNFGEE